MDSSSGSASGAAPRAGELEERRESRTGVLNNPSSVREVATRSRRYAPGVQRLPATRRRAPRRPSPATPPSVRDLAPAPAEKRVARELEFEGEIWSAVLLGAATVGRGMGTGAQVLRLGFEAPASAADPERSVYVAASALEDVHEDVLRKLLSEVAGIDGAKRGSAAIRG